jgi:hypothetical protein
MPPRGYCHDFLDKLARVEKLVARIEEAAAAPIGAKITSPVSVAFDEDDPRAR